MAWNGQKMKYAATNTHSHTCYRLCIIFFLMCKRLYTFHNNKNIWIEIDYITICNQKKEKADHFYYKLILYITKT